MGILNNNFKDIFNEMVNEYRGATGIDTLELKDIIDSASDGTLVGGKDGVVNSLINKIVKTIPIGNNGTYKGKLNDKFYISDKMEYGALVECYDIVSPEVQNNPSYEAVVSGSTVLFDTPVFVPTVHSEVFGKGVSYAFNYSILGSRMKTAFKGVEEFTQFAEWLKLQVINNLAFHKETLHRESLNNYIALKMAYDKVTGHKGHHVININKELEKMFGATEWDSTTKTIEDFRNSPKAQLAFIQVCDFYKNALTDMTDLYNVRGVHRFANDEDLVFIINSSINADINRVALSDSSWNKSFMNGDNKIALTCWQAVKNGNSLNDIKDLCALNVEVETDFASGGDFHGGTKSTVTIDTTAESGNYAGALVLGAMFDRRSLISTTVEERIGQNYDDIKNITNVSVQANEKYLNVMGLNGLVFIWE